VNGRINFEVPLKSLSASPDDASSAEEVRKLQNVRSNKTK
jgi:hypothetical protein